MHAEATPRERRSVWIRATFGKKWGVFTQHTGAILGDTRDVRKLHKAAASGRDTWHAHAVTTLGKIHGIRLHTAATLVGTRLAQRHIIRCGHGRRYAAVYTRLSSCTWRNKLRWRLVMLVQ